MRDDWPDDLVERVAERLWDRKRDCLMHDARYGEISEVERIWLRDVARAVLDMMAACAADAAGEAAEGIVEYAHDVLTRGKPQDRAEIKRRIDGAVAAAVERAVGDSSSKERDRG